MVGGGNRRDEGSLMVNNTNVFAALDSLRKKKKTDKDRGSSKSGKGSSKATKEENKNSVEPTSEVFWTPASIVNKSWADVEDDDDDDYYSSHAPPPSSWGASAPTDELDEKSAAYESESEDDILDEGDDDVEDDLDHEMEAPHYPDSVDEKPVEAPAVAKETERQLSKKEKKKKELAELEALLADFGVAQKDSNGQEESHEPLSERKDADPEAECEKKNGAGESKTAKKKKKKDKSLKEVQFQSTTSEVTNEPDETAASELPEEDPSTFDVKEKLKKMASGKKKKSSKEMDAAAKAAAQEAAARSAKIAAAKKKEKNHYNQQPVR